MTACVSVRVCVSVCVTVTAADVDAGELDTVTSRVLVDAAVVGAPAVPFPLPQPATRAPHTTPAVTRTPSFAVVLSPAANGSRARINRSTCAV
jgi:hypothetical protein